MSDSRLSLAASWIRLALAPVAWRRSILAVALPVWLAAAADAAPASPVAPLNSPGMKAAVDSLLKGGASMTAQDEDSVEEDSDTDSDGKGGLPFEMKKPSRKEVSAFQLAVLGSVTAMRKQDYAKAAKLLSKTDPTERLAQVYKAILLAKAYSGMQDHVRADSVLQGCLAWVGGSVWQNYLLNQRLAAFPFTNPTDSVRLQFYSRVIESPVARSVKVNFLYELLRLQGFSGSPQGNEELLKRLAAMGSSDKRLDSLYQVLAPNAEPGTGTWELQSILLSMESKLGLLPQALRRSEAMLKLVPGKQEKQQLHWGYAQFYFRSKEYRKAIEFYEKFIERYGPTSDAMLQLARCYDRLQEPKKAVLWYDKFLDRFPRHDKTSEIFWLRAWELESMGNYEEAIEFYFRQLADFSSNKRGDWANFRIGLCQFKAGNHAAALQAFHAIRGQPNSSAYSAGLFWEAKAQQRTGDSAGARASLLEVYRTYPFSFYGHLARQSLVSQGAWADSLDPWKRFASSRPEGVKAWMKEEMSGYSERLDHKYESEYLSMGKLLQFRLDTLAILTLKTVPAKVKNNPWFLYVHSRMFQNRGLWKESYKLGLQLSYKIAPEKWGAAPIEVLRLIYPRPYEGPVQKYSAKRGLDPAFVYALVRQESGFDREIKSGAGAVGLMQLMPATGRVLAKKDRIGRFDPYSLVVPELNIRLGTLYLKDLKKDYRDNYYFVLANYNAGPEAARRWLGTLGSKPVEQMIEEISYWETRDYLKKVMGNYWTYRVLWNNRVREAAPVAAR